MKEERRLPELKIVELVRQLASCDAVEDVVQLLAKSAREYARADGVTVVMRDGDRCRYLEEDAIGALWKGRDFAADQCVSGWAMRHRTQVVIPDIRDDPRVPYELYAATFVRSMVMTPIECDGEVIGALGVYWARERVPTESECSALEAISGSAALALVNVRLLAELELDRQRRGQFIDGVAHELARLLGPLRNSLHAQRFSNDANLLRHTGEVISSQLARHARFIEYLHSGGELLAGRSEPSFWPVDAAVPVTLAVQDRRAAARAAGVTLDLVAPRVPLPVHADERRLAQAVGLVIDNSLRFTPPGGQVAVTTGVVDNWVVIEITDSGIGIPADVLARLFEPFHRPQSEPRSSVSGLGLGLSMVARIAQMHGGTAQVVSEGPGQGTRVTLRIPLHEMREDALLDQ